MHTVPISPRTFITQIPRSSETLKSVSARLSVEDDYKEDFVHIIPSAVHMLKLTWLDLQLDNLPLAPDFLKVFKVPALQRFTIRAGDFLHGCRLWDFRQIGSLITSWGCGPFLTELILLNVKGSKVITGSICARSKASAAHQGKLNSKPDLSTNEKEVPTSTRLPLASPIHVPVSEEKLGNSKVPVKSCCRCEIIPDGDLESLLRAAPNLTTLCLPASVDVHAHTLALISQYDLLKYVVDLELATSHPEPFVDLVRNRSIGCSTWPSGGTTTKYQNVAKESGSEKKHPKKQGCSETVLARRVPLDYFHLTVLTNLVHGEQLTEAQIKAQDAELEKELNKHMQFAAVGYVLQFKEGCVGTCRKKHRL